MDKSANIYLEDADKVIVVPNTDDVIWRDPSEFVERLDHIESPNQRLLTLFKSLINFRTDPTLEASFIRYMVSVGGLTGFVLGGIMKSSDIQESYIRKHNASVFDGKYRANRHFWDTLITGCVRKGIKYGAGTSILLGCTGLISFGSITYRNRLYLPDWILGFGTLGAMSRLWVGPRAMVVGGMLGFLVGTFGYGFGKSFELLTNKSVAQIRYLNYMNLEQIKHGELRRKQLDQERIAKDLLDTTYSQPMSK